MNRAQFLMNKHEPTLMTPGRINVQDGFQLVWSGHCPACEQRNEVLFPGPCVIVCDWVGVKNEKPCDHCGRMCSLHLLTFEKVDKP